MKYTTTRFGEIEFNEREVIKIPKGILGFSQLNRYVILDRKEFLSFRWLQSIEDPCVVFLITDPLEFFQNFKLVVNENDLDELGPYESSDLITYVIITVPPDISSATANLIGPVIINTRSKLAKQVVMDKSPFTTKHLLLDGLKSRRKMKKQTTLI